MRALIIIGVCLISTAAMASDPAWLEAVGLKPAERPAELQDSKLSAGQLNSRGMAYYKKKQLEAAALVFYQATQRDKNHVLANYNLACTLALLRQKHGPCSGYDFGEVFEYLKTSIDLDPRRRARAKKDKDFSAGEIQNSLAFRLLLLDALGKPSRLKQALSGTSYQTGSFNYIRTLKLHADGRATWKGARPDPKAQGMGPPPAIAFSEEGRWSVEGRRLNLKGLGDISGWYGVFYGGLKKLKSTRQKLSPATVKNFEFRSLPVEECGH